MNRRSFIAAVAGLFGVKAAPADPIKLYQACKMLSPWPGENYDGASIRRFRNSWGRNWGRDGKWDMEMYYIDPDRETEGGHAVCLF